MTEYDLVQYEVHTNRHGSKAHSKVWGEEQGGAGSKGEVRHPTRPTKLDVFMQN